MLENALEHLVKGIVDNPDDVEVEMVTGRRGRTLEVRVNPEDLGKVIGRSGRTAKALLRGLAVVGQELDVHPADCAGRACSRRRSNVSAAHAEFPPNYAACAWQKG